MVVPIEDLVCLDFLIWLRTGENAAIRLNVSQSHVSRCASSVSRVFGVNLVKIASEWKLIGDQGVLNLERRLHQEYRWTSDQPLRIEAQYYSGPLFCNPVPDRWIVGNFDYVEIHSPLRHLKTGVIDAWIGCYPDVPQDNDPDLSVFHLTRLPTRLVVSAGHPLSDKRSDVTLEDVRRYPSLALPDGAFPRVQAVLERLGLWNLPMTSSRYSHEKWEGKVESDLVVGYATAFTIPLFQAPQVVLPLHIPLEVGDSLVVRRDYSNHSRLRQLLDYLRCRAKDLVKQYPDVTIPDC